MGRGDDEECAGMTNREASRLKPDSACMWGFRGKPGMTRTGAFGNDDLWFRIDECKADSENSHN